MNIAKKIIVFIFVVLGVAAVVAWLLGYPPTKNDNAIADNDGIILIIQALSVIALVLTAFWQGYNNKKIAKNQDILLEKQNNIALFERRYEAYRALNKVSFPIFNASVNNQNKDSFYKDLFARLEVDEEDVLLVWEAKNQVEELKKNNVMMETIKNERISNLNIYIKKLKAKAFINNIITLLNAEALFSDKISKEIKTFRINIDEIVSAIIMEYNDGFAYVVDFDYDRELIKNSADNATSRLKEKIEKEIKTHLVD